MADGTLGLRIWDTNKALFVLICGLNGKFLEIGIIPPCKTYGGANTMMGKSAGGGEPRDKDSISGEAGRGGQAKVTAAWAQISGGL